MLVIEDVEVPPVQHGHLFAAVFPFPDGTKGKTEFGRPGQIGVADVEL